MSDNFPSLPAQLGDLVSVAGYGGKLFFVEAWRKIENIEVDGNFYEAVADLTCANTGEYLEADAEDLTFITDAAQADAYLDANFQPPVDYVIDISELLNGGVPEMKKPEPLKTPRELSSIEAARRAALRKRKAALIDRLLDQRNMYNELSTFFRGGYDGNLAQINDDLTAISAADVGVPLTNTLIIEAEKRADLRIEHRTYDYGGGNSE